MEEKTTKAIDEATKPDVPAEDSQKMDEITLKFGKGCVGEEFQGKDGNKYKEILVPNQDKDDHRPWQTFVVKSNHVHENQYGKGMWCKLPANGSTTLKRNVKIGQDEQGKPIWDTEKTKVPNKDLKKMVESYKERSSVKDKIAEKKNEAAEKTATSKTKEKTHTKSKSKEASL